MNNGLAEIFRRCLWTGQLQLCFTKQNPGVCVFRLMPEVSTEQQFRLGRQTGIKTQTTLVEIQDCKIGLESPCSREVISCSRKIFTPTPQITSLDEQFDIVRLLLQLERQLLDLQQELRMAQCLPGRNLRPQQAESQYQQP